MHKKTIGRICGIGQLATADIFKKIVMNNKANTDQEHIRILIDNNTNIPDRTSYIIEKNNNPVTQLVKSAVTLWAIGAEILVMPCNTAHYFYSQIQNAVDIPVLNMIEITCNTLLKKGIKKAGLLATEGTIKSKIYQNVFENSGIELVKPNKKEQADVMDVIYNGVKAGNEDYDVTDIKKVIDRLLNKGAETLILGCTEIPVAMDMYKLSYPSCDPTLELARAAIVAADGVCI